jgi:hypothetical protein
VPRARRTIAGALVAASIAASCGRDEAPADVAARAEAAARRALARDRVERDPASALTASHARVAALDGSPAGRRLATIDVHNASVWTVSELRGEVSWLDGDGRPAGATAFSLAGAVGPGASERFTAEDGTLSSEVYDGDAPRFRVRLRSAVTREPGRE